MMKKRPWYRPWYIWLGFLAIPILFHVSLYTIDKKETKLKIGYPSQQALARKVRGSFFFFMFVVFWIPTATAALLTTLLTEWLLETTTNFFMQIWYIIYIHPASVYFNYRHARWREENLSHLMKPKKRKTSDEV